MPAGNAHLLVRARNPGVHPGIDPDDLLGPEAVLRRQVVECVFINGRDRLVLTEDGIVLALERVHGCVRELHAVEHERDDQRAAVDSDILHGISLA
jgi:hypothetical protein